MKKILFIALLAFGMSVKAQNIDLYASSMGNYDSITGQNDLIFLKVNPYTAVESMIDTLTDIHGILCGSSTFDQSNHHYIIAGENNSGNTALLVLDTNGTILHENPYIQNISGFQYDLKNQKLYALYQDNPPGFDFITFNQDSGTITQISSLNDIGGYEMGSNTFNSNTSKYIFMGIDNNNIERLYIINAQNGVIESSSAMSGGSLNMLQYDNNANKLFGLYQNGSINPTLFYFVAIDTLTAGITIMDTLTEITNGISSTSSVYDQTTSSYIFIGNDTLGVSRLYVINSTTGQIISNTQIDGNIGELQCDNTEYARDKYHTTNVKNIISNSDDCLIYPNPATNHLTIETPQKSTIEILNLQDQMIKTINTSDKETTIDHVGWTSYVVDISNLSSGVYIIKAMSEKGIAIKKFIKE